MVWQDLLARRPDRCRRSSGRNGGGWRARRPAQASCCAPRRRHLARVRVTVCVHGSGAGTRVD
eukprot:scaffold51847_cov54-Phaeocystis_antarctica.AAC.1